jgi:hypothetical protein
MRRVPATIVAVNKQELLHILSVCLQPYVLRTLCACAILSSMASPALLYYSHYLINGTIFEKMLLKIVFFLFSL